MAFPRITGGNLGCSLKVDGNLDSPVSKGMPCPIRGNETRCRIRLMRPSTRWPHHGPWFQGSMRLRTMGIIRPCRESYHSRPG